MYRKASLPAAVFVFGMFIGNLDAQQLSDCPGLAAGSTYKVALDEITFVSPAGATDPNKETLVRRLRNGLAANLAKLQQDTKQKVIDVRCPGRKPENPTDFTKQMVEGLNGFNTLLEIWGTVNLTPGRGTAGEESQIGYALITLMNYAPTDGPDGVVFVTKPAKKSATAEEVFEGANEIRALILFSLGIKLLRNGEYDAAKEHFCHSEGIFAEIGAGRPGSPHQSIFRYLKELEVKTTEQAQKDNRYRGALKLIGMNTKICGGTT